MKLKQRKIKDNLGIEAGEATSKSAIKQIAELASGQGLELDQALPTIEVLNYTKRFGKFVAADRVSFQVGHGVIHGFIGPNGAGKTTTIKAMIGAYIPTSGTIKINGHQAGSKIANSFIGYIPERASFPPHLNTISYLVAMGELSNLKSKDARIKAMQILKALGLEKHARRKPIAFSSGMQKKILLAQSLLIDPKILILDEPAANLDPTARKELFDQLIALRNQGKTILISSHILAELERIIDEVTFLYYGDVIYSGSTATFNNDVADVFIKSTDNAALVTFLTARQYEVAGDVKTEVEVKNLTRAATGELFTLLSQNASFSIIAFRSNDLQAAYDRLIEQSVRERRGRQALQGEKIVAMKEARDETSGEILVTKTAPSLKAKIKARWKKLVHDYS